MGRALRNSLAQHVGHIDVLLFISALLISLAGLVTMHAYAGENIFFQRQILWLIISVVVFFVFSFIDFRFLRRTSVVTLLFAITVLLLLAVFIFGDVVKGAQSRFYLG